jgi:flagellar protein FliS
MHNPYRALEFRTNDVRGASPIRLVVMAYDLAIFACEQKDYKRSTQAISVLRDALGNEYGEIAEGLFGLYQWCLDCIRQGDYHSAKTTLTDLREAWKDIEERLATESRKHD